MEQITILILDDEPRVREEIGEYLQKREYKVFLATSPSEAFKLLNQNAVDIAIVDIKLPEMNGLEVLERIKSNYTDIEVIMISGHGDMNSVIDAMRLGATDYFQKPFKLIDVNNSIQRTRKFIEISKQLRQSKSTISLLSEQLYQNGSSAMIGQSAAILQIADLMQRVASTDDTSVLITGESGTGKELVAQGIHMLSNRKKNNFHSVNCSAISDSLFESEFFGHRKGSFTGAIDERPGWFEVANKGTLFLDEIGDMPIGQQAKLLRTLEDRKILKVGAQHSIEVDVRVIAASNHNLEKMAEEKKFRSDLFHRLSTFIIHLPPLRERKEDIPLLAMHFLNIYAKKMKKQVDGFSTEVYNSFNTYHFPGNIRELRNLIERALILCDGKQLEMKHFQSLNGKTSKVIVNNALEFDLEYQAKCIIEKALAQTDFNKSKAAGLLNMTWQTLDRRMKKYEIEDLDNS